MQTANTPSKVTTPSAPAVHPVPANAVDTLIKQTTGSLVISSLVSHNEYIADCAEMLLKSASVDADAIEKIPPEVLAESDARLQVVQGQLNAALAKQKSYREPLTQAWDREVVKKFTGCERRVGAALESLVSMRKNIAAEVSKRKAKMEAEGAKKAARDNERINYISAIKTFLSEKVIEFSRKRVEDIVRKFYSIALEQFDTYIENLTAWSPELTDTEFQQLCAGFTFNWVEHDLTKERPPLVTIAELTDIKKDMDALFFQMVNTEKDILKNKSPQRKLELQSGVETNVEVETANQISDFRRTSNQIAESNAAAINTAAAIEKVEAQFEANAAAPVLQHAPGTSTRMVLKPTDAKHWLAIIQKWIAEEFPHCTAEEIAKKFDFALKKMNEMGNINKTWPAGVPLEEDFTVRSKRGVKSK